MENFCPIPFLGLSLQSDGHVLPCCLLPDFVLGKIQDGNLLDLWNSEKIQNLRKEFLSGRRVTCASNMKTSGCHKWFEDLLPFVDPEPFQKALPRHLDIRLHGRCNLKCIMCGVWQNPIGPYNEENFWEIGRKEIFPSLLEIEVLGGEPFIQRDTFRLIEEVSRVNPDCEWKFTSNGHFDFSSSIQKALDRIILYDFTISLDGVTAQTFEKIRKGGNLQKTLGTLQKIMDYRQERRRAGRGFEIYLDMAVQKDNIEEVPAFLALVEEKKLLFNLLLVETPSHLSLTTLPEKEKSRIKENLWRIHHLRKDRKISGFIESL